jgi:hypothetical protein
MYVQDTTLAHSSLADTIALVFHPALAAQLCLSRQFGGFAFGDEVCRVVPAMRQLAKVID